MENLHLYNLINNKCASLDDFLIGKHFIPSKSVLNLNDGLLLNLVYERPNNLTIIFISFCGTNYYGSNVNHFSIGINQPSLKESHGIDLEKFVQKHPELGSTEMFSLNYYIGPIEEKIISCLEFIVKVLSHPELLRVYEGDYYTNEYYKPWYEGNNLD